MGNRTVEVSEYQRAAALGLRNWDLFLNLGLAQLEDSDLDAAIDSLRQECFVVQIILSRTSISRSSLSGADCLPTLSARCWLP